VNPAIHSRLRLCWAGTRKTAFSFNISDFILNSDLCFIGIPPNAGGQNRAFGRLPLFSQSARVEMHDINKLYNVNREYVFYKIGPFSGFFKWALPMLIRGYGNETGEQKGQRDRGSVRIRQYL
jgi:hypothetical protein